MQLRGNHILFSAIQMVTGVLTFSLCWFYGDTGLWALALFFTGLSLTMQRRVDEREAQILYKAVSSGTVVMGAAMAVIYVCAPQLNWFHSSVSLAMLSRGFFVMLYSLRG